MDILPVVSLFIFIPENHLLLKVNQQPLIIKLLL